MIEAATGSHVKFWGGASRGLPAFDAVCGWGRKATANEAMALARHHARPYVSLEDGFIRSVLPGNAEKPASLVVDHSGVHYDANGPSDLEHLVAAAAARPESARAREGLRLLRARRVSKYNHGPMRLPSELGLSAVAPAAGRVLVADQTWGDGAISYGLASARSFEVMIEAAFAENPGAEIVVKTHPEVASGAKRGYLAGAAARGARIVDQAVNPWALIDCCDRVYVVSSLLGCEALLGGRRVTCFGAPFYAGWGLTDDRVGIARRTARPSLEQLFEAVYLDYARYVHPDRPAALTFEEAVEEIVRRRDALLASGRRITSPSPWRVGSRVASQLKGLRNALRGAA
jgi:capsular polysaccharide export protein